MANCAQRNRANDRGFVLIVVIWGLGLVLVLAASFAVTTRSFTKSSANRIILANAQAHADTGIHLALMSLIAARSAKPETAPAIPLNGAPYYCRIADDAALAIIVEDEGGKVDLNGASIALLAALFQGFGASAERASVLTSALMDFRDDDNNKRENGAEVNDYIAAGLALGPRNAPLLAVEELEQVFGVSADLYRALRPFVTVYSRRTGIDPRLAPLPLLAALRGAPPIAEFELHNLDAQREAFELQRAYITPSERSAYTIRVEVHRPNDGLFIRETVVELPRNRSPLYRYLAWRQGERRTNTTPPPATVQETCLPE